MKQLIGLCLMLFSAHLSTNSLLAQRPRFHPMYQELNVAFVSANQFLRQPAPNGAANASGHDISSAVRYKWHTTPRQAFRGSIGYRNWSQTYSEGALIGDKEYQGFDIRAGYERKLNLRRWQVYGGVEAVLRPQNTLKVNESNEAKVPVFINKQYTSYGGAAFLGLRFYANKHVSFALENTLAYTKSPSSPEVAAYMGNTHYNYLSLNASLHWHEMKKHCTCGKPGT